MPAACPLKLMLAKLNVEEALNLMELEAVVAVNVLEAVVVALNSTPGSDGPPEVFVMVTLKNLELPDKSPASVWRAVPFKTKVLELCVNVPPVLV